MLSGEGVRCSPVLFGKAGLVFHTRERGKRDNTQYRLRSSTTVYIKSCTPRAALGKNESVPTVTRREGGRYLLSRGDVL